MNDIKRGQKVWVSLGNEVKETTVKSVGYKYITVDDIEILFDRRTLRKAGSRNSSYCIITDIEKFKKDQYNKGLIDKIKSFKWELVDNEDLEKVVDILRKY